MLRTIGVPIRDVTRSVLAECGALGLLGGIGGIVVGTMVSAQIVTVVLRLVTGWQIPFRLSMGPLAGALVLAAGVSALAGYVPARAAATLETSQPNVD
jgi:ABC-type antimicrobial peptide transport system permease subunit